MTSPTLPATTPTAAVLPTGTRGPLRHTITSADANPAVARAYTLVSRTVRERGLLGRTRWFYALVGSVLAIGFAAAATGFVLLGDSWFQLLIAAALGVLFTQLAFVAHEAAHGQVLASGRANKRLARVLVAAVGMSYSWWQSKHTRHHANPNRVGRDPDIEVDTISFLEEDASRARGLRRLITRHQGWLFFPLLTFEGLNLHVRGIAHLLDRRPVEGRWAELGMIAARFALLLTPVFLLLPLGKSFAFVGVMVAVFGVYMGASFAPNHKGMPVVAPEARLDFFSKQVRTSRNIRGGWWATWLFGGLNYQIEHHLFPNMARPHLAKAREIVRDYCASVGIPYTETSLWRSYGAVIAYLNRVGLAARDPFECPAMAQFRRA